MSTEYNTPASEGATPSGEGDPSYVAAREYLNKLFTREDPQTTCLSVEPHDLKDVRNLRAHFFGCLGIDRRVQVLDDANHPIWQQADKLEKENTELYRKNDSNISDPRPQGDEKPPEKPPGMRYITALNLQAELKRIKVLRRTPALKGLVRDVRTSLNSWRKENEANVKKVQELRVDTTHFSLEQLSKPPEARNQSKRRFTRPMGQDMVANSSKGPEHDDILTEFRRTLKDVIDQERPDTNDETSDTDSEGDEKPPYNLERDIKARLIQLERPDASMSDSSSFMANVMEPDWKDVHEKVFKGTFPDQQVSIYHLLKGKFQRAKEKSPEEKSPEEKSPEEKNPKEKACPSKLSYYHIPVNNMFWVEKAMASYFEERAPEFPGDLDLCDRTKMVLQDSYWRGQQIDCGPDSIVHNRNLRPICEKIPADVDELYRSRESTQENLVLFMPYLHWETDRRRNQAANLIEQLDDEHHRDRREAAQMWKLKRKEDREALDPAELPSNLTAIEYQEPNYYESRGKDRNDILEKLADMLCDKIKVSTPVPLGLVHELWKRIRHEDFDHELLIALGKVINERADAGRIPPSLQRFIWEDEKHQKRRGWRDIVWAIKEAGQSSPTPHALEDILWKKNKRGKGQSRWGEFGQDEGGREARNFDPKQDLPETHHHFQGSKVGWKWPAPTKIQTCPGSSPGCQAL